MGTKTGLRVFLTLLWQIYKKQKPLLGTKTLLHWQKSKQIYFGYKKEIPNGDENSMPLFASLSVTYIKNKSP